MIGTILTCLQLLNELVQMPIQMKENWATYTRLCSRCQIFQSILYTLKENTDLITPTISKALVSLEQTLKRVKRYIEDFSTTGIIAKATRTALRKMHAEELGRLNDQLNDCAIQLNAVSEVDYEAQRREDVKDFRDFFCSCVKKILSDLETKDTNVQDTILQLKDDIRQNQIALQEMISVRKYSPLTKDDVRQIEDDNQSLLTSVETQYREIMSKLTVIQGDTKLMLNILNKLHLSRDEKHNRAKLLQELKLSSSTVHLTDMIIGEGGFGSVHIGTFKVIHKVAIKLISNEPNRRDLESLWEKVENEILLLRFVGSYPTIMTIFGYIQDSQGMQIIMELAPYGSLDGILNDRKSFPSLPCILCLGWFCDISDALTHIHSKQIKHRDIKPENLLVFEKFRLKLCDFGLAKEHHSYRSKTKHSTTGTMGFIAPEIVMGKMSTTASDIYSFAMTAVEILSRSRPRMGDTAAQIDAALRSVATPLPMESMTEIRSILLQSIRYDESGKQQPLDLRPSAAEVLRRFLTIMEQNGGDMRDQMIWHEHRNWMRDLELTAERCFEERIKKYSTTNQLNTSTSHNSVSSKGKLSAKPLMKNVIEVKSLTAEQCVALFESMGCGTVQQFLQNQSMSVTGRDLEYIEEIRDLQDLGINLPTFKLKRILYDLLSFKKGGVPLSLITGATTTAPFSPDDALTNDQELKVDERSLSVSPIDPEFSLPRYSRSSVDETLSYDDQSVSVIDDPSEVDILTIDTPVQLVSAEIMRDVNSHIAVQNIEMHQVVEPMEEEAVKCEEVDLVIGGDTIAPSQESHHTVEVIEKAVDQDIVLEATAKEVEDHQLLEDEIAKSYSKQVIEVIEEESNISDSSPSDDKVEEFTCSNNIPVLSITHPDSITKDLIVEKDNNGDDDGCYDLVYPNSDNQIPSLTESYSPKIGLSSRSLSWRESNSAVEKLDNASDVKWFEYPYIRCNQPSNRACGLWRRAPTHNDVIKLLFFERQALQKSITILKSADKQIAKRIHQNIMGYMGDWTPIKPIPQHTFAVYVLRKGHHHSSLRDEIYLQLMKQLNNNPRLESLHNGWRLMSLFLSTFPPSKLFAPYLLAYFNRKLTLVAESSTSIATTTASSRTSASSSVRVDKATLAVVSYFAGYCRRLFQYILEEKRMWHVFPTIPDIQCFTLRPPIILSITLCNEDIFIPQLPVPPYTIIAHVLQLCFRILEFQSDKEELYQQFGLFLIVEKEEDVGSVNTELILLDNNVYLGDIVQYPCVRGNIRVMLRKKLFLSQPIFDIARHDEYLQKYSFLQLQHDVLQENIIPFVRMDHVIELSAISIVMDWGSDAVIKLQNCIENNEWEVVKKYLPRYVVEEKISMVTWAQGVVEVLPSILQREGVTEDMETFDEVMQKAFSSLFHTFYPIYYGSQWYMVKKQVRQDDFLLPKALQTAVEDARIGINGYGMHLCTMSYALIHTWSFVDIISWEGVESTRVVTCKFRDSSTEVEYAMEFVTASTVLGIVNALTSYAPFFRNQP